MARQFYISNENIINDNQIKISGAEHTHISRVLRLSVSDEIIVSNFIDKEFNCKITEIKKDYTLLKILSTSDLKPTDYNITLFQAIIKGEHMEWCVQKTTELGVTKIIPFISTFTNVKPKDNKQERLSKIAVEACKQSGRNIINRRLITQINISTHHENKQTDKKVWPVKQVFGQNGLIIYRILILHVKIGILTIFHVYNLIKSNKINKNESLTGLLQE